MATLHVAFDPLQAAPLGAPLPGKVAGDAESVDFDAANLPSELLDALDALAYEDAEGPAEPEEEQTILDGFDLGEVGSDDKAGVAASRLPAKGNAQWFSFNLRNVVLACGLVVGSFVLFWTHDLVAPAVGSSDTRPTSAAALRLVNTSRTAGLQTANAPASVLQPVPASPNPALSNNPAMPASLNTGSPGAGTASLGESARVATRAGTASAPVQSQAAASNVSPETATLSGQGQPQGQVNSSAASSASTTASSQSPSDITTERSRLNAVSGSDAAQTSQNGTLFNPINAPRPAPVVAQPVTSEDNPQLTSLPLLSAAQTRALDNTKPGPQPPRSRPRGAKDNKQRVPFGPGPAGKMPRQKPGGKPGETTFFSQQAPAKQ